MSQEKNRVKKKGRGHKGAFALGLVIVCFALVGVVSLVMYAVGGVQTLFNNEAQKSEYEDFLYPVVMLDPEVFDDVTTADMSDLLAASILSLLSQEENSPYNFEFVEGETSGLAIPEETVNKAFSQLFGTDIQPEHKSVECSTCVFEYQNSAARYVIPLTGYDPAYLPDVLEIDKTREGAVALIVGYVAYGDWQVNEDNEYTQPEPSKYRKITLRETDSGYYVSAIQNADASKVTK
ncbi:MAG: hypothetical protein IJZ57_10815 [Clostridia bacterium]|nr:hypothetical protein [Clostridia bacterium]